MKRRDSCHQGGDLGASCEVHAAQLELVLPPPKSAAILAFRNASCFPRSGKQDGLDQVASKRILSFAATLPDW